MRLRPEHLDAIRALNGPGNDFRPVVDLLRDDPANIHAEVRRLLAEMLRADSASPRRLYFRGRGGRPPNGFDPEGTRQRWITALEGVSRQLDAKAARAIAAALDPLATGSPYRLKVRRGREGRPGTELDTWIVEAYNVGGDVADEMASRKGRKHRYRKSIEAVARDLGGDHPKGERNIEQNYRNFKSLGIERSSADRLRQENREIKKTIRPRLKK